MELKERRKKMENEIDWSIKPTVATDWVKGAEYILYIDENGHNSMKNIINKSYENESVEENEKYFNVVATLMTHESFVSIVNDFVKIKHKYWENGLYDYKGKEMVVCFHSEDIRKQKGPFSKNAINQNEFFNDLNSAMKEMKIDIFDCFINKQKLYEKYLDTAKEPYCIAIEYILERVILNIKNKKLMIILESRGHKEDEILLKTIRLLILKGTAYLPSKKFKNIVGVFFNPKRTKDNSKSYIGLEVADLCAYPIYKYCKLNKKDQAFIILEPKIYGYPCYEGRGLKFVP